MYVRGMHQDGCVRTETCPLLSESGRDVNLRIVAGRWPSTGLSGPWYAKSGRLMNRMSSRFLATSVSQQMTLATPTTEGMGFPHCRLCPRRALETALRRAFAPLGTLIAVLGGAGLIHRHNLDPRFVGAVLDERPQLGERPTRGVTFDGGCCERLTHSAVGFLLRSM